MRTTGLVGCMVALFFAFAVPAAAMIQLDRGIAGARIGASRAAVRAALGSPAKVTGGRNDFGAFVRYRYEGGLRVMFQGKRRVTSVFTSGLGDRTASGVGVGSTEAEVDALPGVKCETIAGAGSCHTGSFEPGRRVTSFRVLRGTVASVSVGLVID
jgi:hypothetical protein